MRKTIMAILVLCMSSAVGADDDSAQAKGQKSAEQEFAAIKRERDEAMRAYSVAYGKAKTAAEKNRVARDKYPKPAQYIERFMKLAKDHPKSSAAADALAEVVTGARQGPLFKEALAILSERHFDDARMGMVCQRVVYSPSAETEKFLHRILEKNSHHEAKGMACYSLGRYHKQVARIAKFINDQPSRIAMYERAYGKEYLANLRAVKEADLTKKSEKLFERVVKEFGDVKSYRGTLAKSAERELFEIRNLAIGKVAPEIEGEDIDGVRFKLSDYRGKVVVIDFWGDW